MAERRMFAKTIISSDAFLDMPTSARLLYYDLGMRADDDGFINNPRSTMKMTGAVDDDMRLLIAKKFVIPFQSGIVVIKHWNINNYIQNDRYNATKYKQEKSMLELDENKAYRLPSEEMQPCIQNGYTADTQVRLGKVSIDNTMSDSIESDDAFFERIWLLYPNKKGKGQVSAAKKTKLHNVGYEQIQKAVTRYLADLKKEEWRKPQNGSTFFNSGYVDYLDCNYEQQPKSTQSQKSHIEIIDGEEVTIFE